MGIFYCFYRKWINGFSVYYYWQKVVGPYTKLRDLSFEIQHFPLQPPQGGGAAPGPPPGGQPPGPWLGPSPGPPWASSERKIE